MPEQEWIVAATNVQVPAIFTLRERGYAVSRDEERGGSDEWRAERPDRVLFGNSPVALLGLDALREARGPEPWHRRDGEDWDAVSYRSRR
jgi:hypothetical protein